MPVWLLTYILAAAQMMWLSQKAEPRTATIAISHLGRDCSLSGASLHKPLLDLPHASGLCLITQCIYHTSTTSLLSPLSVNPSFSHLSRLGFSKFYCSEPPSLGNGGRCFVLAHQLKAKTNDITHPGSMEEADERKGEVSLHL